MRQLPSATTKVREQFIVDEHGKPKAVIIPFKAYQRLLEDLDDIAVVEARRDEGWVSWEDVKRRLKVDGLLPR